MKLQKHIKEANIIGRGSFCLMHYEQLSPKASLKKQCEALQQDRNWQESHHVEVMHSIDILIRDIEGTK